MSDDIVVVDSGQVFETTESAINAKEEADKAKLWAEYAEQQADLSEQYSISAEASKDTAVNAVNGFTDVVNNATNTFNQNATNKTNTFNNNATTQTNAFNTNASNKTDDFDDNYTEKLTSFNNNATSKTNTFNQNATDKTNTFNSNAAQKQAAVDASAAEAAESAQQAAQSVTEAAESENNAEIWAEGSDSEVSGLGGIHSAKGWAEQAQSIVSIDDATTSTSGITRYATVEEANAATINNAAVTPAGLANYVDKTSDEEIYGTKTFTASIQVTNEFSGGETNTITITDTNGKGYTSYQAYYTGNNIYARILAYNSVAQKNGYLDVTVNDDGVYRVAVGGNARLGNLTDSSIPSYGQIRGANTTYTGTNTYSSSVNFNGNAYFNTIGTVFNAPSGSTNEGGEFSIGVAPNFQASLGSMIKIDQANNFLRFFRTGGTATSRVFNLDMLNGWIQYQSMATLPETDSTLKVPPTQWVQNRITSVMNSQAAVPGDTYTELSLTSSGQTFTASGNGYFAYKGTSSVNAGCYMLNTTSGLGSQSIPWQGGGGVVLCSLPVKTGDNIQVTYGGSVTYLRFIPLVISD